jgi:hypothetical protein
MALSRAARRKLGNLVDEADRAIAEVILERGGNASNVRQAGHWSGKSLGETAEAAAQGDQAAATAIKIVKQAKRLGEEH